MESATEFKVVRDLRTLIPQIPFGKFVIEDRMTIVPLIVLFKNIPNMLGFIEEDEECCVHIRNIGREEMLELLISVLLQDIKPSEVTYILQQTVNYSKMYVESLLHDIIKDKSRMETLKILRKYLKIGLGTIVPSVLSWYSSLLEEEVTHRFLSSHAKKIQKRYRVAIANPNTQLCKNRLYHEFFSMDSGNITPTHLF